MRRETLFTINTIYREPLGIDGLFFGSGDKTLAVVGSLRGNEVQQLYICSQLVKALEGHEQAGRLAAGCRAGVIPCVNPFSMNLGKRFWAVDNTDINRMFPGYDKGETTQRIAAGLFGHLRGYKYGVQLSSFYLPGNFAPHVRILDAGYHDLDLADSFGLPFVMLGKPVPIDTGTLNYNWQIFETNAFSIYSKETNEVHEESAHCVVEAILSFMASQGILQSMQGQQGHAACETVRPPHLPRHFDEENLLTVLSAKGGIFIPRHTAGDEVAAGTVLADTLDPYTGALKERVAATQAGTVFFNHDSNLIGGHEVIFRIIPAEPD
ncbi:MAG: succinylglutamate desuccinylase/aspartoacylase family protein [Acidobacteriota bacterium]|jgi:predicted deacylase|nr:succinylglutamate desuccinylase/aspartoacylase family protein [Acidobacteriota bacterium]